jgi:hypothetical protein
MRPPWVRLHACMVGLATCMHGGFCYMHAWRVRLHACMRGLGCMHACIQRGLCSVEGGWEGMGRQGGAGLLPAVVCCHIKKEGEALAVYNTDVSVLFHVT